MSARAYWSDDDRCWYAPVSGEFFDAPDKFVAEPVRVEIRDGEMWITRLDSPE